MKLRIIRDTNCLLVSVPKQSQFRWIYEKILQGKIELIITTEILLEYEEILGRFYSIEYAENIIKTIINLPNTVKVNPITFNWLLINDDVDDNKFVDAYVASDPSILVTNDKHFEILKNIKFPEINICRIQEFNKIISQIK